MHNIRRGEVGLGVRAEVRHASASCLVPFRAFESLFDCPGWWRAVQGIDGCVCRDMLVWPFVSLLLLLLFFLGLDLLCFLPSPSNDAEDAHLGGDSTDTSVPSTASAQKALCHTDAGARVLYANQDDAGSQPMGPPEWNNQGVDLHRQLTRVEMPQAYDKAMLLREHERDEREREIQSTKANEDSQISCAELR